jgi:transcriptional regulator with XRE-family HTH domain
MELSESGAVAEYAFLRQMRRHRKLHGLSYEDLAARIKEIGGNLEAEQIAGIEIGDRRLALAEADLLARALGSTVQDVLASAFDDVGEEALRAPSNEEELTAQAKAIERRVFEVGAQVNGAAQRARDAQARVEFARREAEQAQLVFQQVSAEKSSLEREYHYLLGRIDSLRSEMGKETIMQEVEEADGEAPKRPVHSRSGNKAGKPYPGSKAQQEEDLRNAAKRLI